MFSVDFYFRFFMLLWWSLFMVAIYWAIVWNLKNQNGLACGKMDPQIHRYHEGGNCLTVGCYTLCHIKMQEKCVHHYIASPKAAAMEVWFVKSFCMHLIGSVTFNGGSPRPPVWLVLSIDVDLVTDIETSATSGKTLSWVCKLCNVCITVRQTSDNFYVRIRIRIDYNHWCMD